jgi:hypothetical protein
VVRHIESERERIKQNTLEMLQMINLNSILKHDVNGHPLQNAPHLKKQNLFEFWKKYFTNAAASALELTHLPG